MFPKESMNEPTYGLVALWSILLRSFSDRCYPRGSSLLVPDFTIFLLWYFARCHQKRSKNTIEKRYIYIYTTILRELEHFTVSTCSADSLFLCVGSSTPLCHHHLLLLRHFKVPRLRGSPHSLPKKSILSRVPLESLGIAMAMGFQQKWWFHRI